MGLFNRNNDQQRRSEDEVAATPTPSGRDGENRQTSGEQVVQEPSKDSKRNVVRYAKPVPKLKQKLEISTHEEDDSPSSKMWQVYAMAAFMVGRWVWAKVQERRARNSKRDGED